MVMMGKVPGKIRWKLCCVFHWRRNSNKSQLKARGRNNKTRSNVWRVDEGKSSSSVARNVRQRSESTRTAPAMFFLGSQGDTRRSGRRQRKSLQTWLHHGRQHYSANAAFIVDLTLPSVRFMFHCLFVCRSQWKWVSLSLPAAVVDVSAHTHSVSDSAKVQKCTAQRTLSGVELFKLIIGTNLRRWSALKLAKQIASSVALLPRRLFTQFARSACIFYFNGADEEANQRARIFASERQESHFWRNVFKSAASRAQIKAKQKILRCISLYQSEVHKTYDTPTHLRTPFVSHCYVHTESCFQRFPMWKYVAPIGFAVKISREKPLKAFFGSG